MDPAAKVRNLSVQYGDKAALHALDVDIYPSEIIGLIGPNGAGKTSFIKALCGRTEQAKGEVIINGIKMTPDTPRRLHIGLVPQDIALYPHMTAAENLNAFGLMLGIHKKDLAAATQKALEAVDMSAKADIRVGNMSGGMKRRINVATAIMHNPSVIILDEPTAGVDHPARDAIHRLTRELADQGLSIILVTHELEQAEALCDKILLLAGGQKLAFETPSNLLAQCYGATKEIRLCLSEPPKNPAIQSILKHFKLSEGELSTIWSAFTCEDEVSFINNLSALLKEKGEVVREVTIRTPGLPSLMHVIEKTGRLP